MKVAVFSAKSYDRRFLAAVNGRHGHELSFFESKLNADTAQLAAGCDAVCVFVNDKVDAAAIDSLAKLGVTAIALRCAGFNNVDLAAAKRNGIAVVRVPAYSPHAVAEHTLGLILTLNRQIHRAYNRVREHNFDLQGLLGFDLHGKTVGVIGTGKIGVEVVKLFRGFGCRVLAFDVRENTLATEAGATFVSLDELYSSSRIITLHCPLTPETFHLIDADAIAKMSPGVMLVNSSRGAVIDTQAVIAALKAGRVGALAIDVYEEEELFFEDVSGQVLQDDQFARLLTFPNVLVTGHQAFFTEEALTNIAETTLSNLDDLQSGKDCANALIVAN
ncbi:MAG: 2-hydroxyacid dehydrogenase [Planctomycetota bacterium]|nr:2-hydroxyacid dehydrogenase [Planctomycetaceae bacterium]MDQ3331980.1 2-hydroxyacid dehydrogenase [Planctomycetota bacterium]